MPLWLYRAAKLWQYANSEMRQIGYHKRVANDVSAPNRIRELREQRAMTQVELARRANVSPSALNKVESGLRGLDQDWMRRVSKALDVPAADLLPDEDNPDRLGDEQRALLYLYRSADETQRRQIFALIQTLLSPEDIARLLRAA